MEKGKTTLIGLSGGVDSALAALLLKEQGYNVIGVTMKTQNSASTLSKATGKACYDCGKEDDNSAAVVAKQIGIPHIILDCAEDFQKIVLDYFRSEYLAGRTPNPCVRCNYFMKFGLMPELARKQGIDFDYFATGHYAQIEYSEQHAQYVLKKGVEPKKDQTYFLYRLTKGQLAKILMPIGKYTKAETRELAKKYGLVVHDKPDSQDFYSGDYNDLIGAPPRLGNIVDINGKILGKHQGFWNYTPGQRKGMGIAFSEPLYVIELRAEANEVVVGIEKETYHNVCKVEDLSFILPRPVVGDKFQAKIRSAQMPVDVVIKSISDSKMEVGFLTPQKAVAPGQSCVLYDGDLVIGGGIISDYNI